jgi:hypothetical protein
MGIVSDRPRALLRCPAMACSNPTGRPTTTRTLVLDMIAIQRHLFASNFAGDRLASD